ncbi:hypothetical protein [Anthocerotibacter panamensis]|uniref:hypothetical protein n=1 Tax=Anthocerotibacter panamensis TaxID=2857077 RepID=UPI001C405BD8|nr:hypothetical protein [Anthocerotibacter panamensis]
MKSPRYRCGGWLLAWFLTSFCPVLAQTFRHGVFAGNDTNVASAIPVLQGENVQSVRVWANISWTQYTESIAFQQARDFKARGFHVTLLVNTSVVPTYTQAKAYFDWAQTVPGLKDAVDQWEILNELNLPQYWSGTVQQYVQNVLKAAWDSLAPNGEIVVGGSTTTWQLGANNVYGINTTYNQALRDAGYLNYVHYANIHPYTNTVTDMEKFITDVKAIYTTKPILATEWNFKQMPNWQTWNTAIVTVYPFLRQYLAGAYFYRLLQTSGQGGWPGLVTQSYQPQQPFYDTWRQLSL